MHRNLSHCHVGSSVPACETFCKKGPIVHIAQARCASHRIIVGLQRPDAGYGPLELWDVQRRGPPLWTCAPDFNGRGAVCSLTLAAEVDAILAGMCSGCMCIYDVRANRSRCSGDLRHSSSNSRFTGVLAMHMLADMRSFVAVGEGSIDVWDCRYLNHARHSTSLSGAPLPSSSVNIQKRPADEWPGVIGHSLFSPGVCILGADFDANDGLVLLLSTGAAVVMDLTRGFPVPQACIKPHVDLSRLGNHHISPTRSDESVRFGVAWGKQGGHRTVYLSDNMSPPPSMGELGLYGSNPGIYCIFPDNPKHCPPPRIEDPEQGLHWDSWWKCLHPMFPTSSASLAADAAGIRQLQQVRLLQECCHVPLPPGNSRATVDKVLAIAASETLDLLAVATSNGHLQTASARKPPSQHSKEKFVGCSKRPVFSRGTVTSPW